MSKTPGNTRGREPRAPDYGRVVRSLSDRELEEEIRRGRGDPGYRAALADEADRRDRAEESA